MASEGYVAPIKLTRRDGFSRFTLEQPSPEECTESFVRMAIVATREDLTEQSQEEGSEIPETLLSLIPVRNGEWRYESHDIWRFWADPSWFAAQQIAQADTSQQHEFGGPVYG